MDFRFDFPLLQLLRHQYVAAIQENRSLEGLYVWRAGIYDLELGGEIAVGVAGLRGHVAALVDAAAR